MQAKKRHDLAQVPDDAASPGQQPQRERQHGEQHERRAEARDAPGMARAQHPGLARVDVGGDRQPGRGQQEDERRPPPPAAGGRAAGRGRPLTGRASRGARRRRAQAARDLADGGPGQHGVDDRRASGSLPRAPRSRARRARPPSAAASRRARSARTRSTCARSRSGSMRRSSAGTGLAVLAGSG